MTAVFTPNPGKAKMKIATIQITVYGFHHVRTPKTAPIGAPNRTQGTKRYILTLAFLKLKYDGEFPCLTKTGMPKKH